MAGHIRVKSPWSQLGVFLGLFGLAFIVGYIIMGIFAYTLGVADGAEAGKLDWSNPKVAAGLKDYPGCFFYPDLFTCLQ